MEKLSSTLKQLLTTANFENRKELAAYCEKEILGGINQKLKIN